MNDIDNETDPIRKMLLQKDACYLAIMKHRTRKVQSLSTIAMRRLRSYLSTITMLYAVQSDRSPFQCF